MMLRAIFAGVISLASLGAVGCESGVPTAEHPFSSLLVFGDSLSDTGNLRGESNLIPFDPYFNGRISNGRVWVKHVADHFGLAALPAFSGGTNYAHGGSESGAGLASFGGLPIGPNVRGQVELYLDHNRPNGTELFVVWAGANDLFSVLDDGLTKTPEQITNDVWLALSSLYNAGGRSFLVPNLPNLGLTPKYRETDDAMVATLLSDEVNAGVSARLDQLESLTDITIYRLDIAALFDEAVANPPEGVTNVTDPAWSGFFLGYLSGGELVANPDEFLFWDFVHPTRVAHGFIGQAAIQAVESSLVLKDSAPLPLVVFDTNPPPQLVFFGYYLSNLPPFFSQ